MIRPGRYRHFKGGHYEVFAIARHSETQEAMVIYRPIDGDDDGGWWVRPLDMFTEHIDRDGYRGPRFVKVDDQ